MPAGAVRTLDEGLNSDELAGRGTLSTVDHPTVGPVPNLAPPFRLSHTPPVDPVAAPTLGQHTAEILADVLGYDDERIAALTAAGAFGSAPAPPPAPASAPDRLTSNRRRANRVLAPNRRRGTRPRTDLRRVNRGFHGLRDMVGVPGAVTGPVGTGPVGAVRQLKPESWTSPRMWAAWTSPSIGVSTTIWRSSARATS